MKAPSLLERLPGLLERRPLLLIAAVVLLALLVVALNLPGKPPAPTAYFEVRRADLPVSIVEGGTLAAVNEVSIRNEVEGKEARIIYIVKEGSYVKKGDLLVELDSAQAEDQVNQQQINLEKAQFALIQAEAQLKIQESTTNSDIRAADLKVKFAELDRDKFLRGQSFVDLAEASNNVVKTDASLAVARTTYHYSTNLAARGYETLRTVDSDRLNVMNNEFQLLIASNKVWMLREFDLPKQREQLESNLREAKLELDRVIAQSERRIAQYTADLLTQSNTLVLNQKKLERDRKNLAATKILAPQDGLVVYSVAEGRFSSESLVEEGAVVRNRQELIKLPDISRLKVNIKVHESQVSLVRPGLAALVVLDSMPDTPFRGVVQKVAPLPDSQMRFGNPNLKVYNTEVYITDKLPGVKPGVSARAEIIVTNLANVLPVPIHAVTTLKGRPVVYVVNGPKPKPQPVEVGLFNTKFIEIASGVKEGDRLLLSPPFDTQERDLEGSLAGDERAKTLLTNAPAAPRAATRQAAALFEPGTGAPTLERGPTNLLADASGQGEPPDGPGGPRRWEGFNPELMLKQYDKNGDGQLDETEREAMQTAMRERFGGRGGGRPRLSQQEMLKQYDKNGDGQLDETEREAMQTAMRERFGGRGGGPPRLSQEEMLKQYDKNGDGQLDETEREAMQTAMRERFGGQGGGRPRLSQEEMLKQYDKNGDGQLDETEREAMQAAMRERLGGRGGRSRTNAPPARE
jgi:HlyD family secretion protein